MHRLSAMHPMLFLTSGNPRGTGGAMRGAGKRTLQFWAIAVGLAVLAVLSIIKIVT